MPRHARAPSSRTRHPGKPATGGYNFPDNPTDKEDVLMATIAQKVERNVARLDEQRSVEDAVSLMNERNIGSVVITRDGLVSGIFTERDLLRDVAGKGRSPKQVALRDVANTRLIKVAPGDTAEHCIELMRTQQCRHLLVFDGDQFAGIISLRDLLVLLLEEKEELIRNLTKYITS
jgi:CBS domain-containing protein